MILNVWSRYGIIGLIPLEYLVLWAVIKIFLITKDTEMPFLRVSLLAGIAGKYSSHTQGLSSVLIICVGR